MPGKTWPSPSLAGLPGNFRIEIIQTLLQTFACITSNTPLAKANHEASTDHLKDGGESFPGGVVVKSACFQCRGHGLDPWSGN